MKGDDEATKRNHFDPIGPLIPWFFLESVTENRNCLDLKQDNNERVKQDKKLLPPPFSTRTISNRHRPHFIIPVSHKRNLMFQVVLLLLDNLLKARKEFLGPNSKLPPLTHPIFGQGDVNEETTENLSLKQLLDRLLNLRARFWFKCPESYQDILC